MKTKKSNAEHLWKQLEDHLVPQLHLSVTDRAVYSYLLRHSHLEGQRRLHFSISWLAHGTCISGGSARVAVRRLVAHGALRLVERSRSGHLIEVRLPAEICGACPAGITPRPESTTLRGQPRTRSLPVDLETIDFLEPRSRRQLIHSRDQGRCFYCLTRLNRRIQCLDHVVPRARAGRNSYRNLVSSCVDCNSRKGETGATDFLRWLFRERRLTAVELQNRLRALDALATGKLPPPLATSAGPVPRKAARPSSRRLARIATRREQLEPDSHRVYTRRDGFFG